MTTITVLASVPLIFQSVAAYVCGSGNQMTGVTVDNVPYNVCFIMIPSEVNPGWWDSEEIDMLAGNWMTDKWVTSSTHISQLKGLDGSCEQWNSEDDMIKNVSTDCN